MIRRAIFTGVIALLIAVYAGVATAGTVGKLTGRVTDQKGEALPGVNVVISGTNRGAVTDAQGSYLILNVEPGVYQVEASMVGYHRSAQKEVKVVVDYTTTVNFKLVETAVEMSEMVVEASRPAVEPDKTSSKQYVTADDISRMPVVKDTKSIAGLLPGMQSDGLSVRSGYFNMDERLGGGEGAGPSPGWYTTTPGPISTTYSVDGVRMVNNDAKAANMFTGVNRSSIQEIAVVTGVPEAEYSNFDAGLVNIVTKEGGRKLRGFVEYRYSPARQRHFGYSAYDPLVHINSATGKSRIRLDDPRWLNERENIGPDKLPGTEDDTGRLVHAQPDDYTKVKGHFLEGSLSGPLTKNISFNVSAQSEWVPTQRPNPALRSLPNYQLTGKLSFDVTPSVKLKVGGVFGRSEEFIIPPNAREAGLGEGRNVFLPASQSGAGKGITWNGMVYGVLTHSLSPRTLYEVRLSRYDSVRDTAGVPLDTGNPVYDKDGWFTVKRDGRSYQLDRQTRTSLKVDFSSQMTKGNFFKTGVDLTWYRTWEWWQQSSGSPGKYILGTIYDYGETGRDRYGKDGKIDYATDPNRDDPAWNGFQDYPRRPWQFGAYAQDKMEFEGMVINVGVRADAFFHNGQYRPEPFWTAVPTNRWMMDSEAGYYRQSQNPYPSNPQSFPLYSPSPLFQISPRFGISHPITDRSAIHFSVGRFFVLPIFYAMFGQTWQVLPGTLTQDLNNDGRISSYELYGGAAMYEMKRGAVHSKNASTVNFEVGTDWNFVADYTATLTMYYRRANDYLQQDNTWWFDPVEKKDVRSHWYSNGYSTETRGLEIAFRKSFSHHFSFRASYSWYFENNMFYGRTLGLRWFPDSNFVASGAYRFKGDIDKVTGERVWLPLTQDEIKSLGNYANTQIKQRIRDGAEMQQGLPFLDVQNVWVQGWNSSISSFRGPANMRDTPSDGSISMLFSSPREFGPAIKKFRPLGDLNVNLVLRIEPGTFFLYAASIPTPSLNDLVTKNNVLFRNPTAFTTDLGVEKGFKVGDKRMVFFFESTNLFNGKKPRLIRRFNFFPDIPKYGLAENQPNPLVAKQSNTVWDPYSSYDNRTREVHVGLRLSM